MSNHAVTVWCDLDAITKPIPIKTPPISRGDTTRKIVGSGPETALAIIMSNYGRGHSNQNNSKRGKQQRRRKSGK